MMAHKYIQENHQDLGMKYIKGLSADMDNLLLKIYLVGILLSSPKLKAKIGNKMNEGMIAPYKKVLK